jgi:hypothetical protein
MPISMYAEIEEDNSRVPRNYCTCTGCLLYCNGKLMHIIHEIFKTMPEPGHGECCMHYWADVHRHKCLIDECRCDELDDDNYEDREKLMIARSSFPDTYVLWVCANCSTIYVESYDPDKVLISGVTHHMRMYNGKISIEYQYTPNTHEFIYDCKSITDDDACIDDVCIDDVCIDNACIYHPSEVPCHNHVAILAKRFSTLIESIGDSIEFSRLAKDAKDNRYFMNLNLESLNALRRVFDYLVGRNQSEYTHSSNKYLHLMYTNTSSVPKNALKNLQYIINVLNNAGKNYGRSFLQINMPLTHY